MMNFSQKPQKWPKSTVGHSLKVQARMEDKVRIKNLKILFAFFEKFGRESLQRARSHQLSIAEEAETAWHSNTLLLSKVQIFHSRYPRTEDVMASMLQYVHCGWPCLVQSFRDRRRRRRKKNRISRIGLHLYS